ncbi:MAG TPA: hypothetical protein VEK07_15660 [Polyangiaceae bacterium]|nr:hypothetical protein [Polyangiaceae bacterium]
MAIAWPSRSRGLPALPMGALVLALATSGCSFGPGKPLGSGDDLVVDVDATAGAPVPVYDAAATDGPFGAVDGPYGTLAADAYDPVAACDQCACPAGAYCSGTGGAPSASSVPCGNADAGTTLGIACEPLPGGCANEPDCVCLVQAIAPGLACVPVCAGTMGLALYCPNQ